MGRRARFAIAVLKADPTRGGILGECVPRMLWNHAVSCLAGSAVAEGLQLFGSMISGSGNGFEIRCTGESNVGDGGRHNARAGCC
jgi:hypothetical protein